jgi:hypothetical protein
MLPLHILHMTSLCSVSVAAPTVSAGRLYEGATPTDAIGWDSSVGCVTRMVSGTLLVATAQSKLPEAAAARPPSPLLELSVTPVKDGTCS